MQAIFWTNYVWCAIDPLGYISVTFKPQTQHFTCKQMHFEMSSAKWQPVCLNPTCRGLTRCGLMTPYGDIDLCQYRVKKWIVVSHLLNKCWIIIHKYRVIHLKHCSDVPMRDYLLNRLFRRGSKKTSKLRVTGLCERNSPVTGEFLSRKTSNAENVSIWWHHHEIITWGYYNAN